MLVLFGGRGLTVDRLMVEVLLRGFQRFAPGMRRRRPRGWMVGTWGEDWSVGCFGCLCKVLGRN